MRGAVGIESRRRLAHVRPAPALFSVSCAATSILFCRSGTAAAQRMKQLSCSLVISV